MSIGLIGRKCGMTRVFCEDGSSVPVTVLQIDSNRVTQVKSLDVDGYRSIQVAAGDKKSSRVNKAMADRLNVGSDELVGNTCFSLIHGTNKPLFNG